MVTSVAVNEIEAPYAATLGPQGRVVIPAEIRKQLGYEPGTVLNIWLEDGEIRLKSRAAARESAKAMFRRNKKAGSLADELIAERRSARD